jgi:hypothetical protein|tara:strand:+ start:562 stop:774 length:213 start_codon:yes stop_codon:yes gene_type:complete
MNIGKVQEVKGKSRRGSVLYKRIMIVSENGDIETALFTGKDLDAALGRIDKNKDLSQTPTTMDKFVKFFM